MNKSFLIFLSGRFFFADECINISDICMCNNNLSDTFINYYVRGMHVYYLDTAVLRFLCFWKDM